LGEALITEPDVLEMAMTNHARAPDFSQGKM